MAPGDGGKDPLGLSSMQAVLGGGLAGCLGKTATAPLTLLTVLAQTSSLRQQGATGSRATLAEGGMYGCIRYIVTREGVLALWKGNTLTCLHRFPFAAINFSVFEHCKSTRAMGNSWHGRCLAGAIAGCAAVVSCYPLDLLRTRAMAADGRSCVAKAAAATLRREGLLGMYRGLGPSLLLTVPSISASFGTYDALKARLATLGVPHTSPLAMLLAGGCSGVAGSALTFPIDVVRRRLQVMGPGSGIPTRTLAQEAAAIMQTEGPRGFWRGFGPDVVKTFPMVAITFLGFELFKGAA